ncbi:MAG: N-acetylmannosamine-6-phosphate 2-epimerase [Bacteroidota bacterium]|nr:N-acetylmannosamine-6-phosphate 2-epimerase [Bacteroidota bacterium]
MKSSKETFEKLKNKLIVSCQAEGESPFNSPEGVTLFAKAAIQGGAAGIRSEGVEKTKKILNEISVPVIGLSKSYFSDGYVRITGSIVEVESLINIGSHIIAIDGTFRKREGLTGPEFINKIKENYDCLIMADISTEKEAVECQDAGADCISTTLNGYTPETIDAKVCGPNYMLLRTLASLLKVPVFAEGRINTPDAAAEMIKNGAWSVVAGSAITRPTLITQWYIDAMKKVLSQYAD